MKRPMLWALFFLAAGILIGRYGSGMALFCVLLVLTVCLYKHYKYGPVFLFLLFALVGLIRVRESLAVRIPSETGSIAITGVVVDTGRTASGNEKLIVNAAWDEPDGKRTARIMAYLRPGQHAEPGQSVHLTGVVKPLDAAKNPGDYNEFLTLRSLKIDGKIYPATFKAEKGNVSITAMLYRCRNKLAEVYDKTLPEREASIIKSIILGDKAALTEDIREQYRLAGLYHLLCISGLHISILMLAVNRLLGRVMNKRMAGLVALGIMMAYCLMTGASVSTVRAVTMCGVAVFAQVLFRDYDLPASVSFACVGLLIYEPLYLYNAGFQLSFGAVFGIAALTAPVEHALTLTKLPIPKKFKSALAANIAAVAATFPILSYHFYYISTYSLFVNLIILPTAAVLVVFGLLIGLTGLLWFQAGLFLSGIVFYLLRFYDEVCRFFNSLPLSVLRTGCCGLAVCAASVGVIVAFVYTFSTFGGQLKKRALWLMASIGVLIICGAARAYPSGLTITVLDAGPNECAVLDYRAYTLIIGGGNPDKVAAYLDRLGKSRADVITINEQDMADARSLVEQGRIGKWYLPAGLTEENELTHMAYLMEEGDLLTLGDLTVNVSPHSVAVALKNARICFENETHEADVVIRNKKVTPLRGGDEQVYSVAEAGAVIIKTNGKRIHITANEGDNREIFKGRFKAINL